MSNRILVDDLRSGKKYDFRYNNENCTACRLDIVTPDNLTFAQPLHSDDEDEQGIEWELVIPMADAHNIRFYVTADGDTDVESQGTQGSLQNSQGSSDGSQWSQGSQGGKKKTRKTKKSKKAKTSRKATKTKKSKKAKTSRKATKTKK